MLANFFRGFGGNKQDLDWEEYFSELETPMTYMVKMNPVTVVKRENSYTVYFNEVTGKRMHINLDFSIKNKVDELWKLIENKSKNINYIFVHLRHKTDVNYKLLIHKIPLGVGICAFIKGELVWYTLDNEYKSLAEAINDINFNSYDVVAVR